MASFTYKDAFITMAEEIIAHCSQCGSDIKNNHTCDCSCSPNARDWIIAPHQTMSIGTEGDEFWLERFPSNTFLLGRKCSFLLCQEATISDEIDPYHVYKVL